MTSKSTEPQQAYVWIWLPGSAEPVVAGLLNAQGDRLVFNYGRSYLERESAIPIYAPELPLKRGELPLLPGMSMPSCLRDASPDAWGRRVIINRKFGRTHQGEGVSELTYLLESGSDRIGALDFQASPTEYVPRTARQAGLDELLRAAELVEQGIPLTPELEQALNHGTSIGGARPKALIEEGERKWIAKFSAGTDAYSVVKAEFLAMRLARLCGLSVADVRMVRSGKKDVLLVERFDRTKTDSTWLRHLMVSALTLMELDEMFARHASYETLAELIRARFSEPKHTLRELFGRIVFNILCGNTDDHARNHSAFWDGQSLSLTPAYDICPQNRTGGEATQAMLIQGSDRMSRISSCLNAASLFLLTESEAIAIVMGQILVINQHWADVCEEGEVSTVDQNLFWGRQFLNPFAFEDLTGAWSEIGDLAGSVRQR